MSRVSIALAVYNGGKYLDEQLQSFINQSRLPDEVVLCDDCSEDDSLFIARKFAERAPFSVRIYINEKNLGYTQNFSIALAQCTGDIVFLSDQDDVWLPKKIERVLVEFEKRAEMQLLIHDLAYCNDYLKPIGQTKIERMEDIFDLNSNFVVGMATAIRYSFLQFCLPIPQVIGVTHDLWLHQCAGSIGRKAIFREVLALYRRHTTNTTLKSKLNVDFVTTKKHFRVKFKSIIDINDSSNRLLKIMTSPLPEWLELNREKLIGEGFCTAKLIYNAINLENIKIDNARERFFILKLSRGRRVIPIICFYLKGGYKFFSGLKSAGKDFIQVV